jgi:poly-gamma-glutamate capsule biosynthesis protein CapA/YwtB (metallophosphatase superfamily)
MAELAASLTLCAAGDVALGGILEGRLDTRQARQDLIAQVRSGFGDADIGFVDLDCTFDTSGTRPRPEEYAVTAGAAQLELLRELGVDIVSQANNHCFDHGWQSVQATRRELAARGIASFGAGANLSAARAPVILERRGRSVGFLGYASEHPWVDAVAATAASPGVAPLDTAAMLDDVGALRDTVDWVVVSVHWGKEFVHYPPPTGLRLGRALIDAGASVVLGHHPHVIQGIEEYHKGVIAYSLGNFIFPDYPQQRLAFGGVQRESIVASVELAPSGARLAGKQLIRMADSGSLVELAGAEHDRLAADLAGFSEALSRSDYAALWQQQVRSQELRRLWRVLDEEVLQAGWRGGAQRLLSLGWKNVGSVGRSLSEIVLGTGRKSG